MTELERRALMGDKQAQEECTKQGIILPCPMCGKESETIGRKSKGELAYQIRCENKKCLLHSICKRHKSLIAALADWNDRPTPPIGWCRDCKNSPDIGTKTKGMRWCRRFRAEVKQDGYCEGFKPKECEYQEQQYLYHL